MARSQSVVTQGERDYATKVFKDFKGCYTKSDRSAVPDGYFAFLENMQPIGPGNLHSVPGPSASLHNFSGDSVYFAQFAQIGAVPFLFIFTTNGKVFTWNFNTSTAVQINSGHLFSGAGSRMAQWQTKYILFVDSTGYYSWDGTTFTVLTALGGNVPTAGVDIMVFSGRVWVANGRLVTISSANDGTAATDPTTLAGWSTANGGTFLNLTDPTLVGAVTRLWAQNGFGYIFGTTCIYAIADVYVPAGASPPTPVYTIIPIQSIIGTDQPASVFPENRSLLFANRYGAYAIDGVNAVRLSEDIDGTWQFVTFSQSVSGGLCVVNNILTVAFLIQGPIDPIFGTQTLLALWFNKKWWFGNLGAITFVCTAIVNAVPTLCAFIGNQLFTLFTNSSTSPNGYAMTPLWDMDDPISDKQVIRAGFLSVVAAQTGNFSATVDGFNGRSPLNNTVMAEYLTFVNNSGGAITFTGTGGAAINWTSFNSYVLFNGASPPAFSQAVGMTIQSSGANWQLINILMDYKLGAQWQPQ